MVIPQSASMVTVKVTDVYAMMASLETTVTLVSDSLWCYHKCCLLCYD